jgi:hypothetical protein
MNEDMLRKYDEELETIENLSLPDENEDLYSSFPLLLQYMSH